MEFDLDRCIRGEKEAWDAFVRRYLPVIYSSVLRTFTRRVARPLDEDVQDAAQEVFIRLVKDGYRCLKSYRADKAGLVTWLTVISHHVALDVLRRKKLPTVPLNEEALGRPAPAADRGEPFRLVPGSLPPRQEAAFRLLVDCGLGVPAAARRLGVDETTVRTMKHKALTTLRKHSDSRGSSE